MSLSYEYCTFRVPSEPGAWRNAASHILGAGRGALHEAGGELYGLFSPQLGFASNEGVIASVWTESHNMRASGHALQGAEDIAVTSSNRLAPTVRPIDRSTLYDSDAPIGGIFIHRWFTVEADGVDRFIELSGEAWETFEKSFDAQIQGLFQADRTAEDEERCVTRLLLLTHYASHGVWEQSRDDSADPDAWAKFLERHKLTRETIGRSTLLVGGQDSVSDSR